MAIDIVKVRTDIRNGDLMVTFHNGNILLKDMRSGEAVKISELPIYEAESERWISISARLPTKEDADEDGAVYAFNKNDGYATNWEWDSVANNPKDFTYWMSIPDVPKDGE